MRRIFILLIVLFPYIVSAQYTSYTGTPFIENHTKNSYKAGNQNWSIAQAESGVIYAANNNGLMSYDGVQWKLYPSKKRGPLRSVAVSKDGLIYVGGREEFGFYTANSQGEMLYTSLSHLVEPDLLKNDDIWKILFLDDAVLFQSFSKLYIYKNHKIDLRYGEGEPFLFAYKTQDQLLIEKIPSGLQIWDKGQFKTLKTKLSNVLSVLPLTNGELLIGTAKEGLFKMKANGEINVWNLERDLQEQLKDAQINNGIKIDEQNLAFGTIKSGVFIINTKGQLIQHIHKRNGLQNNTVLSLFLDKQHNIWAGLDHGIDRIEINSPFYYYKDIFGELGSVYAIKVFKGRIYIGTNQGLFHSAWPKLGQKQAFDFHFMPGSQGQVWTLNIFNDQLICGHNEGTYLVDEQSYSKISEHTGAWLNYQPINQQNIFIQGNYTGLALFEAKPNWQLKLKYEQPNEAVIDLRPMDSHSFWAVLNKELKQYELSLDYQGINNVVSYNFQHDFPNIERMSLATIRNNSILATDKGLFIHDNLLDKFTPYEDLNNILGSFKRSSKIIALDKSNYMFANLGQFALLNFDSDNAIVDSVRFSRLRDQTIEDHEIVEPYDNLYIFGLDQGFSIYDNNYKQAGRIQKPLITGMTDISSQSDSSIRPLNLDKTLSYKQNNIRIEFALPWYDSSPTLYQYRLKGYTSKWSSVSEKPYVDYAGLPAGKYIFEIKAQTASGLKSEITSFEFEIARPWYWQWYAIIAYLLFVVFLYILINRRVEKNLRNKERIIRENVEKEQTEILQREAEENERKLIELENIQLQKELVQKNRELSNVTTHIVYKNELLSNLHQELRNVKDNSGKKLSDEQLTKVNKLMDNAKSDERDWDIFEQSFNESHGDFFKKLKAEFPSLSPNDMKLCAYLRLNMTSKDIASLLHISTRGVEIRRYRLRKKFDIPTEKNLTEFLLER